MTVDSADVVVVGGGVSGLSSAWWLARNGVDVILIEKEIVGWEASGRNGGIFGHRGASPTVGLAVFEEDIWPLMDDMLGYPTEACYGTVVVAMDDEEWERLEDGVKQANAFGAPTEIIDVQSIRELMPVVSPEVRGGAYKRTGGHANPQRTCQAYAWAIQDHGGRIYQHTTVIDFETEGDRVVTVKIDKGDFGAGYVVCAAGPQTGILAERVGAFIPVAPGRPEIIVTAPLERMWLGAVMGNGLYGRQTERGNLAYGGGWHEWIDVDLETPEKPNTPLVRYLARRVAELFSGAENFLVVTMSGDGFGLSPATGKAVADLVLHGETSIGIDDLRLGRFADVPADWREQRGWVPGVDTGTREYGI